MRFFSKSQQRKMENTFSGQLSEKVEVRQQKLAKYLNRKASSINGKTLLLLLIIFCALYGSYCLYLIINAFN